MVALTRVLILLVLAVLVPAAHAATYVVNTTDVDLPDTNTALAGCDANAGLLGDQCTLRAAIMQANAGAGQDTIVLPLDAVITLTIGGLGEAESGDLDITQPVIITGASFGYPADFNRLPVIEAANSNRIFDVTAAVAVELRGLRLRDGAPSGASGSNGGALRVFSAGAQVLVENSRLSGNVAGNGGAISNVGTLTMVGVDFSRNRVTGLGAALYNDGSATLRASSLRGVLDESATAEAIHTTPGSTLVLENTVIDGSPDPVSPTATGGIFADRPATLTVRNSTLSGFSQVALNLVADGGTTLRLYNSILANSDDADCRISVIAGPAPDLRIEYNILRDSECGAYDGIGNQVAIDPVLEILTTSGGSFVTALRLLYNSPAIDTGVPPDLMGGDPARLCLSTDLRGGSRPLDGDANGTARCDLGASEASTLTSVTYTVNVYDQDLLDLVPGDGICDAVNVALGSQCTLRAAVMEANARGGPDRIQFADVGDNTVTLTLPGAGGAQQGDLDVTDEVVISGLLEDGRPVTTITTSQLQRLFEVSLSFNRTARFENLRLVGGDATGAGDSTGGAIQLSSDNLVTVEGVEFAGNAATKQGGAIAVMEGNMLVRNVDLHDNSVGTQGAAIYALGQLGMERSSVWNNVNASGTEREAVRLEGEVVYTVLNSTFSGNTGGLWAVGAQQLNLRGLTVVDNTQFGLRAVEGVVGMQVNLQSSILAGNGLQDCSVVAGAALNPDYNLVQDGSCAPGGTNIGGNPKLAPALALLDGELTRVRFPLAGSPVLDAVPAGDDGCLTVDQRASVRPTDSDSTGGAACEMGALELFQAEAAPRNFTVNVYEQDRDDNNPGDAFCDTSSNPGPQCTLRAAVMESNALPGLNVIQLPVAGATAVLTQPLVAGPASAAHGDLDITDAVTIQGVSGNPGVRPSVQASNGDRIFNVSAAGDAVVISGLRLTGGATSGTGGALRVVNADTVDVQKVSMFANTADQGGGAVSVSGGVVTLDQVDLYNNGTVGDGAAIRNASDLTLSRSSVRGNLDLQPADQREAIAGLAGGVTRILNSTLSGNSGVAVDIDDGTLQMENTTVFDNDGRGIEFERVTDRVLFLRDSILSGNGGGGCATSGPGNATISTNGYNLTQGNGCAIESGGSNVVSTADALAPLTVDPTRYSAYHLPLAGGAAVDTGHPVVGPLGCLVSDQLDVARAIDGDGNGVARCDIGAIEAPTVVLGASVFSDSFED